MGAGWTADLALRQGDLDAVPSSRCGELVVVTGVEISGREGPG
jgi:hypothetical protein